MKPARIVLTAPKGLVPYLKAEVLALGYPVKAETETSIRTEGAMADAMLFALRLRTCHRVLVHLTDIRAENADQLYSHATAYPWEDLLDERGYVCVTSHVENPTIRDSRYANVKLKDAIADHMVRVRGSRPDSGPLRDRSVVHLHWTGGWASLYADASGEPLSFRGYRREGVEAPMRETLASAIVMATGWRGEGAFVNPMCGAGTIAIEAALLALGRAPGILRKNFGFMHLRGYERGAWERLREEARVGEAETLPGRILASDIDRAAVAIARDNARRAGVERNIEFSVRDFREVEVPDGGGVVVMNPPYGERMKGDAALPGLYKEIGDFLKRKCAGYAGYVFTGNRELGKNIGLRTKRRLQFWNGPIECRLLAYNLYSSSASAPELSR